MAKWTAEDWDRSESAGEMLRAIRLSRRKLRLFATALCHRFREHITDPRSLAALAGAERDAEAPMDKVEQRAIWLPANYTLCVPGTRNTNDLVAKACFNALHPSPHVAAGLTSMRIADAACWALFTEPPSDDAWRAATRAEHNLQANLLRHIVGNPFRPFPAPPPPLPATVVQLAAALEAGEPVAFALRDALLEAGQTELAEHFAGEAPHPRGCWVLDLVLGKV